MRRSDSSGDVHHDAGQEDVSVDEEHDGVSKKSVVVPQWKVIGMQELHSVSDLDLSVLTILNLVSCNLKSLPEAIWACPSLLWLDLSSNQLSSLPEAVGKWTALQKLDLGHNKLRSLPKAVGNWTAMEYLFLVNTELSSLPDTVGNWTAMQELYLLNNQLTSLPEAAGNWMAMLELNLSFNKLISLPESVGNWTTMQKLDLDNNKLRLLPQTVGNWTALQSLKLCNNQLSSLPLVAGKWRLLGQLHLRGNPIQISELINQEAQFVVSYYQRLAAASRRLRTQRIMFIGHTSKGKTSLRMRLMANRSAPPLMADMRTFGIDIVRWSDPHLRVVRDGFELDVEVEFWDFAGQPLFYPTHQMFMRARAVFWIVFSWEDNANDIVEQVEEHYQFVQSSAPDMPVMLIGTHSDKLSPEALQEKVWLVMVGLEGSALNRGGMWRAGVQIVSSRHDGDFGREDGIKRLRSDLGTLLQELPYLGELVPELDARVEKEVFGMRELIAKQQQERKSFLCRVGYAGITDRVVYLEPPVLGVNEFAKKFKVPIADIRNVLVLLSLRGVVLFQEGDEIVYLDPQWLTRDVVGDIADNTNKFKTVRGKLSRKDLDFHWPWLDPRVREMMSDILVKFKLAMPVADDCWLVPLLAEAWSNEHDGLFCRNTKTRYRVQLSHTIPGIFALLQFHWWKMRPVEQHHCIRKDKSWVMMRPKNVKADCFVGLSNDNCVEFDIADDASKWLAWLLIAVMEECISVRFPGIRLTVGEVCMELKDVVKAWKSNTVLVYRLDEHHPCDLLPLPRHCQGSLAVKRLGAQASALLCCEVVCLSWEKGFVVRFGTADVSEQEIEFGANGKQVVLSTKLGKRLLDSAPELVAIMTGVKTDEAGVAERSARVRTPCKVAESFGEFARMQIAKPAELGDDWAAAFHVKAKTETTMANDLVLENLMEPLKSAFRLRLVNELPELSAFFGVDVKVVGSILKGTNLDTSDADVFVVMNSLARAEFSKGHVTWNNVALSGEGGRFKVFSDCFFKAVTDLVEFANDKFGVVLKRSGITRCCVHFGLRTFDVFPAVGLFGDPFVLMDGSRAVLTRNIGEARQLDSFAKSFVGMKELIRCAKTVKEEWNEAVSRLGETCPQLATACKAFIHSKDSKMEILGEEASEADAVALSFKLRSSIFEAAAFRVANASESYDALAEDIKKWRGTSFRKLFRAMFKVVRMSVKSGKPRLGPKKVTGEYVDQLSCFREGNYKEDTVKMWVAGMRNALLRWLDEIVATCDNQERLEALILRPRVAEHLFDEPPFIDRQDKL